MGDLQICSPRSNGVVFSEDRLNLSSPSSSSSSLGSSPPLPVSHPDPSLIAEDCWGIAEETAYHIISRIRPTFPAEQKRTEVIDYVQRLIRGCIGCEVFAYGSVPLKTYLPDGDIDLTAISSPNIEDALVSDVHAALICEEHNEGAQYEVKDVHYIDAEVKLVKCIIENIVVDISFNQLGGLCTLCFLEQVDRLVGRDHLFKRSIILIKAWCYYESRILGAHHGLISTYALETLVLYIFHVFHSSLNGPLSVLYRFLDYFSKFDWENYCISLNGPVCKSSLPDIVVKVPENGGDGLLLSEEFLRNCVDMFSVPARGIETNSRAFPLKHLNIIDPLRESNNLGRSVNKGNFFRIRSAFKYGARKLGWILLLPKERTTSELNKFFANTLDRHGSCYENDVQSYALASGDCGVSASLTGVSSLILSQADFDADRTVSQCRLAGDAKELATSNISGMRSKDESSNGALIRDLHIPLSGNSRHFTSLFRENGKFKNGMQATAISDDEKFTVGPESSVVSNSPQSVDSVSPGPVTNIFEGSYHGFREWGVAGSTHGSGEALESLVDLNGDHDNHIRCLQYGQHCHGYPLSVPIVPIPPISFQLGNKNPWETICQSIQLKKNVSSQTNKKCGVSGPQVYSVNSPTLCSPFGLDEKKKQRGTGTYFPNLNYRSTSERPSQGGGRNQTRGMQTELQKHPRNNCSTVVPREMNSSDESSHELSQADFPVLGNGKSISPDSYRSQAPKWGPSHANSVSSPPENLEFGSDGPQPNAAPVTNPDSITSPHSPLVQPVVSPKSEPDKTQDRTEELSFQLKYEDNFPPLSL